jgi:hypothetical protein
MCAQTDSCRTQPNFTHSGIIIRPCVLVLLVSNGIARMASQEPPGTTTLNTVDLDPAIIASDDQSSSLFDIVRPGTSTAETASTGARQAITVEPGLSVVDPDGDPIVRDLLNNLFFTASRIAPTHLDCSCPVAIAWWRIDDASKPKHSCSWSQVHKLNLIDIASTKTNAEAMDALSTRLPKSSGRWSILRGADTFLLYAGTTNQETAISLGSEDWVVKSWVRCRIV